jgi:hypothetical protein
VHFSKTIEMLVFEVKINCEIHIFEDERSKIMETG